MGFAVSPADADHNLQIIKQEFFQALSTTRYGRFRWNAHLLQLPRLLGGSGHSVDPVTHCRPTYSFQRSVANVPPALQDPPDGTVQSEPATECAPTASPEPLLFSIVNIESTAPLFSLWNIEFVLLVLLDHAPPPHSGGHDRRDLQRFSISIFPNMSPG